MAAYDRPSARSARMRAMAEIVESKTDLGLTLGQTKKLFERQGLVLSRGGIQQILAHRELNRAARGARRWYESARGDRTPSVRSSPVGPK